MRLLLLLSVLSIQMFALSQLTGSVSTNQGMACVNGTQPTLTFTASGGTAPYTFSYSINGGATQQISTNAGSNSVTLNASTTIAGNFNYVLTQVEDALLTVANPSSSVFITINPNPVPNAGSDQVICEGSALTIGDGVAQPGWTFIWNGPNGFMSTIGTPVLNPVTPAMSGVYTVFVSDQFGCMGQDNVSINVVPLPTEPSISVDSALCNNGGLTITEPANYGPYSVLWGNGITTFENTGLSAGTYTYQLINAFGCVFNGAATVPQSLLPAECATVSGSVRIDANSDCLMDAGDVPVQNRLIRANPGNFLASTDVNGNYTLYLEPGDYTIDEIFPNESTANACTSTFPVSLPDINADVTGINFLDTITDGVDLSIELVTTQIRPQLNAVVDIIVSNQSGSGLTAGINGWFTLPAGIDLLSFNTSYTQSNDTVYFQVFSTQTMAYLQGTVFNSSLSTGAIAAFHAGIDTLPGESITANNYTLYQTIVVNSFDPNDKTTFINGIQNDSSIYLSEQSLKYLIRFQNTGTAEAIDIHIMDTISEYLDLNTFEFLGSSHPCNVYFHGRSVKFDFPGIYLPDSTSNEPESHGFVLYRIRQAQTNEIGDVINNTAHIFFDFNEAVITNTTWDELVEPSTDNVSELEELKVRIYPNPATDELYISSEDEPVTYRILSSDGAVVAESPQPMLMSQVELKELAPGLYLVECTSGEHRRTARIVKY